ncbi:MAG: hypothetical protein ABEH56_04265 [Salinirussus sp.]
MGLADIAAGIEVTAEQRDRGVATVDDTDASLAEQLEPFAAALPCEPDAAGTVLDRYAAGGSVGAAARAADLASTTAAKTLHLLGESVSPVGEVGRQAVREWIAGEVSRSEALELARVSEAELALAAYVETHDPLDGGRAVVQSAVAERRAGTDPLADARSEATDLLGSDRR